MTVKRAKRPESKQPSIIITIITITITTDIIDGLYIPDGAAVITIITTTIIIITIIATTKGEASRGGRRARGSRALRCPHFRGAVEMPVRAVKNSI